MVLFKQSCSAGWSVQTCKGQAEHLKFKNWAMVDEKLDTFVMKAPGDQEFMTSLGSSFHSSLLLEKNAFNLSVV